MFNNNNNNNPNVQELLASFEQHIKTLNEKVRTFEDEMTNLKNENFRLDKEVKQLRFTVRNSSFGPVSSKFHKSLQKVGRNDFGGIFFDYDDDDEDDEFTGLGHDVFSLLKVRPVLSRSWIFSLTVYIVQLMLLFMIFFQQFNASDGSTPFDVPYSVGWFARWGQYLALCVTVALSNDIFGPIKELSSLWLTNEDSWLKVTGPIKETKPFVMWAVRILIPNMMQLIVGLLALLVSFIIIAQSDDVINLFAEFAAMSVIGELDNIAFWFAEQGYAGAEIQKDSVTVQKVQIEDKILYIRFGRYASFNLRTSLFVFLLATTITCFTPILIGQNSGNYFGLKYPECFVASDLISTFNDGKCDGGLQNSYKCGFDDGDCIDFNIAYPICDTSEPESVGDGVCDEKNDKKECSYDGGDCCVKKEDLALGDSICHAGHFNTAKCLYDSGDCDVLRNAYPSCPDYAENVVDDKGNPIEIGNGRCDQGKENIDAYMNDDCGWVFGDCEELREKNIKMNNKYPNCDVSQHFRIEDGVCDGGEYLTADCGWDGYDCCDLDHSSIGDGTCDSTEENDYLYLTKECGYENFDCCDYTELVDNGQCAEGVVDQKLNIYLSPEDVTNNPQCAFDGNDCIVKGYPDCNVDVPSRIGDGFCNNDKNPGKYNTEECGYDGGDCIKLNSKYPLCTSEKVAKLGNGRCDETKSNTEECGYDDGDCILFNARYPDCDASTPYKVGDGFCNQRFNTTECKNDGGDCIGVQNQFNLDYPLCAVEDPSEVGNGKCRDDADYNIAACGWDGGDCFDINMILNVQYPDCKFLDNPHLLGDGECSGGTYNTEECGFDDGDCDYFNTNYPNCKINFPKALGNGICENYGGENTVECGWDDGDCIIPKYPDCHVEIPRYMGDGECDGGDYNTEECGFDDGDCEDFNTKYPDCIVKITKYIGNGECDGGDYNTEECGFDGGDCDDFNLKYPECVVEFPKYVGDGYCDFFGDYDTEECGFDGGDC